MKKEGLSVRSQWHSFFFRTAHRPTNHMLKVLFYIILYIPTMVWSFESLAPTCSASVGAFLCGGGNIHKSHRDKSCWQLVASTCCKVRRGIAADNLILARIIKPAAETCFCGGFDAPMCIHQRAAEAAHMHEKLHSHCKPRARLPCCVCMWHSAN